MDASDPVVFASSVVARQLKRKQRPIPQQVLQYLKNKEIEEDVDEGFSIFIRTFINRNPIGKIFFYKRAIVKKQEKEELEPITLHINNIPIIITPKFHTTLIDGKVFNIITETSSQSCPVCEAKPKDFLKRENCKSTEEGLLHGCQSLHAIVNVFNFLLKLAYRMDNLKWQARGQKEKDSVAERKFQIQERLKRAFGITFDCPRSGGFGNTTTGNLCRRAFAEPGKLLSEALYLDVDLVTNLKRVGLFLAVGGGGGGNCRRNDIENLIFFGKEH
ncbi:hypothetical protein PVAND_010299 [Polypedilum vanderplanki]|uniref:Uncharacterized protein n=1 Tax=Polypedilum vanderplanki TaxID=319348 RepID=A0A9J6CGU8_POLVA|nr:hypothetical protein PVAND_010299 [Polypedilum vanderplanki]